MATLSPAEIAKLPKYAKQHVGNRYKLSDIVYIDNKEGVGASKSHADIVTRGFISFLPVDEYLSICGANTPTEECITKISSIVERVKSGEGIACPRLFLDIEEYMDFRKAGKSKVVDHDGCMAVAAMKMLGIEVVTVQVVLLGYSMRNIENKSDFFNHLSFGIVAKNGGHFKGLVRQVG